jgi:hypothetical protein
VNARANSLPFGHQRSYGIRRLPRIICQRKTPRRPSTLLRRRLVEDEVPSKTANATTTFTPKRQGKHCVFRPRSPVRPDFSTACDEQANAPLRQGYDTLGGVLQPYSFYKVRLQIRRGDKYRLFWIAMLCLRIGDPLTSLRNVVKTDREDFDIVILYSQAQEVVESV